MRYNKEVKERETKDIIMNGFIYILVKDNYCNEKRPLPCFMGHSGWALHSVMKRKIKQKMIRTKWTIQLYK
jgi:hypothetical protein